MAKKTKAARAASTRQKLHLEFGETWGGLPRCPTGGIYALPIGLKFPKNYTNGKRVTLFVQCKADGFYVDDTKYASPQEAAEVITKLYERNSKTNISAPHFFDLIRQLRRFYKNERIKRTAPPMRQQRERLEPMAPTFAIEIYDTLVAAYPSLRGRG